MYNLVPDPDLQVGGEGRGGGMGGRDGLKKIPFGPQFGLKIRGGAGCPRSATVTCKCINGIPHEDFAVSLQEAMPFT